ncbi:MAG: sugar transferase [Actinobacteria bacterium]|nr:sugar transferase [Actinomycetota bacterium]
MSAEVTSSAFTAPVPLAEVEVTEVAPDRSTAPARRGSAGLRRLLVALDTVAAATAWGVALGLASPSTPPAGLALRAWVVLAATLATVALVASQRLYLARVSSVKAVETARLARVSALTGLLVLGFARAVDLTVSVPEGAVGAALSFALLAAVRGGYRSYLNAQRRRGRFSRPVVIVGGNEEADDLCRLLLDHPEVGFHVVGVVGRLGRARRGLRDVPWLGEVPDAVEAIRLAGANGALVAASAVPSYELNAVVRQLLAAGVHVHLSSGLRGIATSRLLAQAFAHEPLFYLEPATLSPVQRRVKRTMDLGLGGVGLVLAAPVLAAAAVAIRLTDSGPVLFGQRRVGRDGRVFTCWKLRTMVVDAEQRLVRLRAGNERHGPLFKLERDPRVTRVGRLLRATSLDELPQLFNVLRGEMSLVGPRPALPEEVEQFHDSLRERLRVLPGITGLWQVEARDNPSFRAYQRLDIFYIENWSVLLDAAILFATVTGVVGRGLVSVRRHLTGDRDPVTPAVID